MKTYSESDRSRAGASKKGWRLVYLQGCPVFMESLKQYEHDYKFPVGCGQILIRGGSGRPKSLARSAPAGRGAGGGAWANHQQSQSQLQPLPGPSIKPPHYSTQRRQQQHHQQSFGHQQFPDPDISAVSRGRGRSSVSGRRPGWAGIGAAEAPDLGAWSSTK